MRDPKVALSTPLADIVRVHVTRNKSGFATAAGSARRVASTARLSKRRGKSQLELAEGEVRDVSKLPLGGRGAVPRDVEPTDEGAGGRQDQPYFLLFP